MIIVSKIVVRYKVELKQSALDLLLRIAFVLQLLELLLVLLFFAKPVSID